MRSRSREQSSTLYFGVGGKGIRIEVAIATKDGQEDYWLTYKFPLGERAGRRYVGGMALDISGRRKMINDFSKQPFEWQLPRTTPPSNALLCVALTAINSGRNLAAAVKLPLIASMQSGCSNPTRRRPTMRRIPSLIIIATCLAPMSLLADTYSHGAGRVESTVGPTKKLETDETLRAAMTRIAGSLGTRWDAIRNSRLSNGDYLILAKEIQIELTDVVAKCKLPPESDRAFHEVLGDMNRGVDLMNSRRPDLQRTGALALAQALKNYGKYFDHPGWSARL